MHRLAAVCLSQVCYYLSPFCTRINLQYKLPKELGFIDGMVLPTSSHRSKQTPKIHAGELQTHIERLELEDVLDTPCIKENKFRFSSVISKLHYALKHYHARLIKIAVSMQEGASRQDTFGCTT